MGKRMYIAILQIMTATVETVAEQLDLAAIMPAEKVVTAVARSVTLSDSDVGMCRIYLFRINAKVYVYFFR